MKTIEDVKKLHADGKLIGQFSDIPIEVYHHPECPGFSKSFLDNVAVSPAHAIYRKKEPKDTDDLRKGSAIHTLLLEPELFDQKFKKAPDGITRRTNEGKAFFEKAKQSGLTVLSENDYADVISAVESLKSHEWVPRFLKDEGGVVENSFFWIDPTTKLLCKARPDLLRGDGLVVDFKKTREGNAKADRFMWSMRDWRYHVQGAFFKDGIQHAIGRQTGHFVLIVVEDSAPHGISIFVVEPKAIDQGRKQYLTDLLRVQDCLSKKAWPCYDPHPQPLDLPEQAYRLEFPELDALSDLRKAQ